MKLDREHVTTNEGEPKGNWTLAKGDNRDRLPVFAEGESPSGGGDGCSGSWTSVDRAHLTKCIASENEKERNARCCASKTRARRTKSPQQRLGRSYKGVR